MRILLKQLSSDLYSYINLFGELSLMSSFQDVRLLEKPVHIQGELYDGVFTDGYTGIIYYVKIEYGYDEGHLCSSYDCKELYCINISDEMYSIYIDLWNDMNRIPEVEPIF